MRELFFITVVALNLCDCAVNKDNRLFEADNVEVSKTNSNRSVVSADANDGGSIAETRPENSEMDRSSKRFWVDIYEDNRLIDRLFFSNNRLIKEISYNTETNSEEFVTEFYYKKNGDFDRLRVSTGGSPAAEDVFIQRAQDFEAHQKLLLSNKIKLPIAAEIMSSEVEDIADVFSVADSSSNSKKEIMVNGNQKVIRFAGINENIDFKKSPTALVIGNDLMLVLDYELTMENALPSKEQYLGEGGELTKSYSYNDGRLTGIVYEFVDRQYRTTFLTKQFVYHQLKG